MAGAPELEEPEPPALTLGVETDGVDTDGVDTDGVETDGVETDVPGTCTDGTVTEGTWTEGTLTLGRLTEGTLTAGRWTGPTPTPGTVTSGTETDGTETPGRFSEVAAETDAVADPAASTTSMPITASGVARRVWRQRRLEIIPLRSMPGPRLLRGRSPVFSQFGAIHATPNRSKPARPDPGASAGADLTDSEPVRSRERRRRA